MRAVAADNPPGIGNTCAVHQNSRGAKLVCDMGNGTLGIVRTGHVAGHGQAANVIGDFLRCINIDVEQGNFSAFVCQRARCRGTQTRSATRNNRCLALNVHNASPH